MFQDTIREKMYPISQLHKKGKINWYYFLFHSKSNDLNSLYFDIKFTSDFADPNKFLPDYCIDTTKIRPLNTIAGIDAKILKNEDITEAWRIIGEQSKWLLELFSIHKEGACIPPEQIGQFLHFYANMSCIAVR